MRRILQPLDLISGGNGKDGKVRISENRDKERKEHLDRIESASAKMVHTASMSYETNRVINLIVVAIGIVLISNSIVYGWYKGVTDWTLFSGGLGAVSFITLFFTRPQQGINTALCNLAQIQAIYKSYCLQLDAILDLHLQQESKATLDEVSRINGEFKSITTDTVKLIEDNVEKFTKSASKQKR